MLSNTCASIPVTDTGLLAGIIGRDISPLRRAMQAKPGPGEANYLLGKLKVSDIMTKSVWTVRESDSVETAAYLLYTHSWPCSVGL